MKVFISFSGDTSREIADALAGWLPRVLQAVRPFCSQNHISKGARWTHEISKALEDAAVGIICVTSENQSSAWLNFEAGALSKRFESSYVCPLLFGISKGTLDWPLGGFQSAEFSQEEMKKVLVMINERLREVDRHVSDELLEHALSREWPTLATAVAAAMERTRAAVPQRREEGDMLEELLTLTRGVFASMAQEREQREIRDNRFLRALQPTDPLVEAVAEYLRTHPDADSNAGYRAFLGQSSPPRTLKAIGGDFRWSGGDADLIKKGAPNPQLADDKTEQQ